MRQHRENNFIDLHAHALHSDRFAGRENLLPLDYQTILRNSRPLRNGAACLRKMDDIHHILILIQHVIKHSFSKRIWLMDLHELLAGRSPEFLDRFEAAVIRYGQQRPVAYVLYLLQVMFGFTARQIPERRGRDIRLSRVERAVLQANDRLGTAGDLGNLLWLYCEDSRARRIRWFLHMLLPETANQGCKFTPDHCRQAHTAGIVRKLSRLWSNLRLLCRVVVSAA